MSGRGWHEGLERVARCVAVAVAVVMVGGLAAPAAASQYPRNGVQGVSVQCSSSSYSCTAGGYGGWEPWGYYAPYGSRDAAGRLHNCTTYAAFRAAQNGARKPPWYAHAIGWDDQARATGTPVVDHNPAPGSIAQWNSDDLGHVAVVESVDAAGLVITDDNYGANVTRRVRIAPGSPAWPDNFLHFADGSPPPGGGGTPPPGSPFGTVDHFSGAGGGLVQLAGWTIDPDDPRLSGVIHVYADGPAGSGRFLGAIDAANSRPDVAAVHAGAGDAHGFADVLGGVGPGAHEVFVYAINRAGGGSNPLIGRNTITVPDLPAGSPFGAFDEAQPLIGGRARLRGWAVDPDDKDQPLEIHAYVDGPAGVSPRGINLGHPSSSRPDVAAAVPGAGSDQGVDATIDRLSPGRHTVFLYALNAAGAGAHTLIGTKSVDVIGSGPLANVEHLSGGVGGFIQIAGWSFDPDVPRERGEVHVYIDGPAGSGARGVVLAAENHRPDVAHVFPGVTAAHGFSAAIPGVAPGAHTVYVYAINRAGEGTNPLIRVETVQVPATAAGSPFGAFDAARSAPGGARVLGWTIDPDSPTAATEVHAYLDGPAGTGVPGWNLGRASARRDDVAAVYPSAGARHGLDARLQDLPPGKHTVWLYAINAAGGGGNPLLGSKVVETGRVTSPAGAAPVAQPQASTPPGAAAGAAPPVPLRPALRVVRRRGFVTLRWRKVAGATRYRVVVRAGRRTVRRTVAGTRLTVRTRRRKLTVRITALPARRTLRFKVTGTAVRRLP